MSPIQCGVHFYLFLWNAMADWLDFFWVNIYLSHRSVTVKGFHLSRQDALTVNDFISWACIVHSVMYILLHIFRFPRPFHFIYLCKHLSCRKVRDGERNSVSFFKMHSLWIILYLGHVSDTMWGTFYFISIDCHGRFTSFLIETIYLSVRCVIAKDFDLLFSRCTHCKWFCILSMSST
jgi:hypothetical protein